ncbi:hypothetical protein CPC08DRAFT_719449 [Agrocybe pediades]|nr:hypothetical protein CPC08DRAFT_719449 [Agrocybe pediades]
MSTTMESLRRSASAYWGKEDECFDLGGTGIIGGEYRSKGRRGWPDVRTALSFILLQIFSATLVLFRWYRGKVANRQLAFGCSAQDLARRFGDIVLDVEGMDLRFRVVYVAVVVLELVDREFELLCRAATTSENEFITDEWCIATGVLQQYGWRSGCFTQRAQWNSSFATSKYKWSALSERCLEVQMDEEDFPGRIHAVDDGELNESGTRRVFILFDGNAQFLCNPGQHDFNVCSTSTWKGKTSTNDYVATERDPLGQGVA